MSKLYLYSVRKHTAYLWQASERKLEG